MWIGNVWSGCLSRVLRFHGYRVERERVCVCVCMRVRKFLFWRCRFVGMDWIG